MPWPGYDRGARGKRPSRGLITDEERVLSRNRRLGNFLSLLPTYYPPGCRPFPAPGVVPGVAWLKTFGVCAPRNVR